MLNQRDEGRQLPARHPEYPQIQHLSPQHEIFGYPGEDEEAVHLLDYWRVILIRRWTVMAVLATIVAFAAIYTFRQVPVYRATARIQIDRENPNILSFQDVYAIESVTDDALQTQFEILSSRSLARRVIEDLDLVEHPEFARSGPGPLASSLGSVRTLLGRDAPPAPEPGETDRMREMINGYLDRLRVSPVRQSRLVDVSFQSPDPEFAARVITGHAQHFIEQNLQFKFDAMQEASVFLEGQLVTLQVNLERAEDRLQEYSVANDILFTGEGLNTAMSKLQQLDAEYTTAQADRFQKEAYRRLIDSGNTNTLPQLMQNAFVTNLSSRLVELEREDAELSVTFNPEYPRRQRIQSQIAEIQSTVDEEHLRIIAAVESEHIAAVEREELLTTTVSAQLAIVNQINQEIIQYNILKREVDSNQQLYNGLLTRLKEAGISAGLRASNIRIVDRADVPAQPVSPRRGLNMLLSLIAGLTFGIGLAFFQEYMDNSIKSPEDVARYLNVPTIAAVPKREAFAAQQSYGRLSQGDGALGLLNPLDQVELVAAESPSSVMAEAYRSMRTSLLLSSADHPPKSVLVTSALPSEGKTVTAINLAASLTQTGASVVLVDADMRKPRVHSVFALGATPGLSAVLTGSAGIKEVLHEVSTEKLHLLPCGVIPPNPAELIMSKRFQRLLGALREYFDYVVIDSPPLSSVSDARILGSQADATLLVRQILQHIAPGSRKRRQQPLERPCPNRRCRAERHRRTRSGLRLSILLLLRPVLHRHSCAPDSPVTENNDSSGRH